ncbi:MAG: hypothetical protein NT069_29585, partial [Planctomycetota bacterium]|nr:hypothetical protein [Planctomycetota bacterium]
MHNTQLTEGARRVLLLAELLGQHTHSHELEPAHLIWAMWLDESRGAEILQAHGVKQHDLAEAVPRLAELQ